MAIKLAITSDQSEYAVWCMLDDDSFNPHPHERGESFVLGTGPTVHVAIDLAQKELAKAAGDAAVLAFDASVKDLLELGVIEIPPPRRYSEADILKARLEDLGAFFVDGILDNVDQEVSGAVDADYRDGLRTRLIARLAAAMNLAVAQEVEAIASELLQEER